MGNLPAASARPEIIPVSDMLDNVMSGEVRVPRFQRPYVWSPDDMIQLFDSVLKGYPIGSLLIWQTDRRDITSLNAIGPIVLPQTGPLLKSYVVDGHQRLATLLGVLRLPEDHPRDRMDDWRWWIAYDLRAEQFIHIKDVVRDIPLHLLPLRSVLRTADFARRTREIVSTDKFDADEAELLLDRADVVQRAIREYRIPMTVMRSGSLDDAVTIFARVNQRGRDMTPDQMVSALTYREEGDGAFDLAASIDRILGDMRSVGFGDLQRRIILQIILALSDLDFTRPSYERIVDRASHQKMRPAVERAAVAIRRSVSFLNAHIGLTSSRLLPYASIMVMLAIYFDELDRSGYVDVPQSQILLMQKWFWAVSFNGWFAGANTTDIRRAGEIVRSVARQDRQSVAVFDRLFFNRPIRQFPQTFDRRSARVRASLLVQIISGKPRDLITGSIIDGTAIFGDLAARDIPYFFPNQRRPAVSNPANRVILPEGYSRNARLAFIQARDQVDGAAILASHFVTDDAYDGLYFDDFEHFIVNREAAILAAEHRFLSQFGLALDVGAARNNEEVDADE